MKSEQLTFEQMVEAGKILNDLTSENKDIIMTMLLKSNEVVIDYENRIKNAINQLER